MKLIIDIDEQHFEILQSAVRNGMGDNSQKIIANGIPLSKIRAELHATAEMHIDGGYYLRDEWIDEIFDKYRAERSE